MKNLRGAKIVKQDSLMTEDSHLYIKAKDSEYCELTILDENGKKRNVGAYNFKDDIDGKQKKLSSFDESILIESDGNIEGNVSLFTEYFQQQVCELNFIPTQIIGVYQDGIKLLPEEFNITLPKTITVITYSTEKIEIQYTHLKNN